MPQYTTTFTSTASVTVPGVSHLLGTALLFVSVYTLVAGKQVQSASAVTIDPTSFDVVVTFATPQSGELCLSAAGPRYSTTFTSTTSLTILGSTHGLETAALLYQVYDAASPRHLIEANTLSVDPVSFNVVLTFGTPQSGTILLVGATGISGHDFQIRDRGITNVNAVRVFSTLGQLHLQMGSGELLIIENAPGALAAAIGSQGNLLITGEATKPAGASWVNPSDLRLKTVLRPFTDGLELLLQMEPVWFVHNGLGGIRPDGREHVSLIAQAAQLIAPYLVGTIPGHLEPGGPATELLTLDTSPLFYLLLNAVKALHQTQLAQEARLASLEAARIAPRGACSMIVRTLVSLCLLLLLGPSLAWAQGQLINGSRVITGTLNAATTTGTPNAYVLTLNPAITAYVVNQCFTFRASFTNTGAATLNINSVGASVLKKYLGTVAQ